MRDGLSLSCKGVAITGATKMFDVKHLTGAIDHLESDSAGVYGVSGLILA